LRNISRDGAKDAFEPVKVKEIFSNILDLCTERIKARNVKLDIQFPEESVQVTARAIQIEQILLNLLNNSNDAIESLSEKWIKLSAKAYPDRVQIIITDSGNGIPEAIAQNLMQPFFTTKADGRGTGLGLSISLRIAQEHHGNLYYDSSNPHTSFILELPRAI
jgi:C4-dicarboxylate-specific signal transduction histidine kinase